MKLSSKAFIQSSKDPKTLEFLLSLGEKAYSTWQGLWSPFIEPPIVEEALSIFDRLSEISCYADGGYLGAQRKRIFFQRTQEENLKILPCTQIIGLQIEGNFLFDKTNTNDFKNALQEKGVSAEDFGDLWIIGDRGAQLICTEEIGNLLNQQEGIIREVKINYKSIPIEKLRLPRKLQPKTITTIEASTRLDAIASAGFGISRAKIVAQIKSGQIRINWTKTTQANRSVNQGDKIQYEGKGNLLIKTLEATKKNRWRVVLQRE